MKQPTIPAYGAALIAMFQRGECKPGIVSHVNVLHDDWCNIWRGQECNCDFEIQRVPGPGVAVGGAQWQAGTRKEGLEVE